MIFGIGFPPFRGGLCAHADARGAAAVVDALSRLASEKGPRFNPAPLLVDMASRGRRSHFAKEEPCRRENRERRRRRRPDTPKPLLPEVPLPGGTSTSRSSSRTRRSRSDTKETVDGLRRRLPRLRRRRTSTPRRSTREHFFPRDVVKGLGDLGVDGDDDPRGVRRQRLQRDRLLQDDGGHRAARRLGRRSSSAPTSRSASSRSSSSGPTSRRRSGSPTSRPGRSSARSA